MAKTPKPKTQTPAAQSGQAQISLMKLEQMVRMTNLFFEGEVIDSPASSAKDPPKLDIIQNLPTHIQSIKSPVGKKIYGGLDLGCAHRLYDLKDYQRLVIGIYDIEKSTDAQGLEVVVQCYHTVIEIILSPKTLQAMRGRITSEDLNKIREQLDKFDAKVCPIGKARPYFHAMTNKIRKKMGIVGTSVRIVGKKPHLQSYLALFALEQQVIREGRIIDRGIYRGNITQVNYREFTDTFYGLQLPWRTSANHRFLARSRDPDKPT